MSYPTIYVTISDGKRHLAIDGHLYLLSQFISSLQGDGQASNKSHSPNSFNPKEVQQGRALGEGVEDES